MRDGQLYTEVRVRNIILHAHTELARHFSQSPLIAYKRDTNIRDMLVRSKLRPTVTHTPGTTGQVRSECLTCTFRASCCSAHCHGHTHRYRPSPVPLSGTEKKGGEGVRVTACTGGYMEVRAVRPESIASGQEPLHATRISVKRALSSVPLSMPMDKMLYECYQTFQMPDL